MHNQDWSLILFTSLSQLSVGLILFFSIHHYLVSDVLLIEKGLNLYNPVLLALIFVGIATFISLMHLGSPIKAPNTLKNIAGSWVSREILGLSLYSASLLLLFFLGWKFESLSIYKYFLPICALLGLIFIWFMIRIYNIPTIPAWNHWNTPVSFCTSMVIFGIVALLSLKLIGYLELSELFSNRMIITLFIFLIIELCLGIFHQSRLESLNSGIDELVFNQGPFYSVFISRMFLIIISLIIIFFCQFYGECFAVKSDNVLLYLMFFLIIIQEIMGRYLFYASYFRLGV